MGEKGVGSNIWQVVLVTRALRGSSKECRRAAAAAAAAVVVVAAAMVAIGHC